ncbi:MAG: sel1 repeat family protein [Robiginitomaculum sp.]|nr:sel1 repeat family protein [Robiginitomaculum sp.]
MAIFAVLGSEFVHAQIPETALNTSSQTSLELFEQAKSYHDGRGVRIDIVKAIEIYQKAANLGNTDAILNLGFIYFTGQGGVQDYNKARQYYYQAAKTGDRSAQENLGLMYEHGLGVKANTKTAKLWYDKSKGLLPPIKPEPVKPVVIKPAQELREQNIPPASLEPIKLPVALLAISLPAKPDSVDNTTGEAALSILSETITGKPAFASQVKSIPPLNDFKAQNFGVIHLPNWASPLIISSLFGLALLSAIWFSLQFRNLHYRNERYKFTSLFFEDHRESLRGSYLRTPHSHRQYSLPHQPWAVSLCSLMVRFAAIRQADPNIDCPISNRVVKRLKNAPYAAREEVFGFIPMVQDRLYFDINSLSEDKYSPPKPYQFGHSKFFLNRAKKNKLK